MRLGEEQYTLLMDDFVHHQRLFVSATDAN